MQINKLEVVARDGIEPSTRGFSIQRRGRFGASKPKKRDEFSAAPTEPPSPTEPIPNPAGAGRPNPGAGAMRVNELRASRPSFFRTGHRPRRWTTGAQTTEAQISTFSPEVSRDSRRRPQQLQCSKTPDPPIGPAPVSGQGRSHLGSGDRSYLSDHPSPLITSLAT